MMISVDKFPIIINLIIDDFYRWKEYPIFH